MEAFLKDSRTLAWGKDIASVAFQASFEDRSQVAFDLVKCPSFDFHKDRNLDEDIAPDLEDVETAFLAVDVVCFVACQGYRQAVSPSWQIALEA